MCWVWCVKNIRNDLNSSQWWLFLKASLSWRLQTAWTRLPGIPHKQVSPLKSSSQHHVLERADSIQRSLLIVLNRLHPFWQTFCFFLKNSSTHMEYVHIIPHIWNMCILVWLKPLLQTCSLWKTGITVGFNYMYIKCLQLFIASLAKGGVTTWT